MREREQEREQKLGIGRGEAEGRAVSPLSQEPDVGLYPRNLGS